MKKTTVRGILRILSAMLIPIVVLFSPVRMAKSFASFGDCSALLSHPSWDSDCDCATEPSGDGACPRGKRWDEYYTCEGPGQDVNNCFSKALPVGSYYQCSRSVNWANMLTCIGGGAALGSPGGPIGSLLGGTLGMVICFGCTTVDCDVGSPIADVVDTKAYSYQGGCPD